MKRIRYISFFLLTVYLFTNNLWVVPFLGYWSNLDYIIKNYCVERDLEENTCMGSCYLNNEVKKTFMEKKYGHSEEETPSYNIVVSSLHIIPLDIIVIKPYESDYKFYTERYPLTNTFSEIILPPPKNNLS